MHAKIKAYKGYLVCELLAEKSIDGEVASSIDNPGNFGQVIMDSGKHVGISPEAYELLKTIRPGRDAIGDVDWFGSSDGKAAFCWIGPPRQLIKASVAVGSRDYRTNYPYVEIENDVPEQAIEAIDAIV